jgi:prolyl-tRNA synthetase
VQQDLLEAAKRRLHSRTLPVSSYEQMKELMLSADTAQHGLYLAPWCCDAVHEAAVKEETKATIRCYPFEHNQHAPAQGTLCFYSGRQATHMALFARAY